MPRPECPSTPEYEYTVHVAGPELIQGEPREFRDQVVIAVRVRQALPGSRRGQVVWQQFVGSDPFGDFPARAANAERAAVDWATERKEYDRNRAHRIRVGWKTATEIVANASVDPEGIEETEDSESEQEASLEDRGSDE